jgi:hypothetical protein
MDPDSRRRLDRALRLRRLKTAALILAVLSPILAILAILWLPPRPDGVVLAELTGFETRPSDDTTPLRMVLRLPDGATLRLRPGPGDASRAPGGTICLARGILPLTGAARYQPIPDARCVGLDQQP